MRLALSVALGVLVACVGSLWSVFLFERALRGSVRVSLAVGVASIAVSFLTLLAVLFLGYLLASEEFPAYAIALVASFLVLWTVEAVRGWRAANGRG